MLSSSGYQNEVDQIELIVISVHLLIMYLYFNTGVPKDGHKEEGRTAQTSEGEIRNKHRPPKIIFFTFTMNCIGF